MVPRPTLLLTVLLAALAPLAASAVPTQGPFTGALMQGQTGLHLYDNMPPDGVCPQYLVPLPYTLTLAYSPPTDTLTLEVVGRHVPVAGSNGLASVTILGGGCETLLIAVTGTSVATVATYTVSVSNTGSAGEDS